VSFAYFNLLSAACRVFALSELNILWLFTCFCIIFV